MKRPTRQVRPGFKKPGATDYAMREYGLTAKQVARAEKRVIAEIGAARKRGEVTRFTGSLSDFS